MPIHYNQEQINYLIARFIELHPWKELNDNYASFEWDNARQPNAWNIRNELSMNLRNTIQNRSLENILSAAHDIHRWGFGSDIPQEILDQDDFTDDLYTMLTFFMKTTVRKLTVRTR